MAKFATTFDTYINIFRRAGSEPLIGVNSKYAEEPHPNTDNLIDGFKFDKTKWGTDLDENLAFSVPTLWDPSTQGIGDLLVPGIGDGNDLKVLRIKDTFEDFKDRWRPEILHGYYYTGRDEF